MPAMHAAAQPVKDARRRAVTASGAQSGTHIEASLEPPPQLTPEQAELIAMSIRAQIKAPEIAPGGQPRNGNYRVHFVHKGAPGGTAYFPFKVHEDSPMLSTMKDYIGPLTDQELEWLEKGKRTPDMVFTVIPIKPKRSRKVEQH